MEGSKPNMKNKGSCMLAVDMVMMFAAGGMYAGG